MTIQAYRKKFARALRQIMKIHRLTQVELAGELEVRQQYISQIVNGGVYPNEETFDRISEYLRPRITEEQYDCLLELYAGALPGEPKETGRPEGAAPASLDALEMLFIFKFRSLKPEQQIGIMRQLEQLCRNNEDEMAQNAGLEPRN